MPVGFIDPVTPSGAQAAEGFRSNLVEKARLDLEHTRIATQADLQKAQIDAEVEMKKAEMRHSMLLQQQSQQFQAGQQTQRIGAEQSMQDKRLEEEAKIAQMGRDHAEKLQRDRMDFETQKDQLAAERQATVLEAGAAAQRDLAKREDEINAQIRTNDMQMLQNQIAQAKLEENKKNFGDELNTAVDHMAATNKTADEVTATAFRESIARKKTEEAGKETRGLASLGEFDATDADSATAGLTSGTVSGAVQGTAAVLGSGGLALSKGGGDMLRALASAMGANVEYHRTALNNSTEFVENVAANAAKDVATMAGADPTAVSESFKKVLYGVMQNNAANAAKNPPGGRDGLVSTASQAMAEGVAELRKAGLSDIQIRAMLRETAQHASGVEGDVMREKDAKGLGSGEQKQAAKSFQMLAHADRLVDAALTRNKDSVAPLGKVEDSVTMKDAIAAHIATLMDTSQSKQDFEKQLKSYGFNDKKKVAELVDHFEKNFSGAKTSEQYNARKIELQSEKGALEAKKERYKQEGATAAAEGTAKALRQRIPMPRK